MFSDILGRHYTHSGTDVCQHNTLWSHNIADSVDACHVRPHAIIHLDSACARYVHAGRLQANIRNIRLEANSHKHLISLQEPITL